MFLVARTLFIGRKRTVSIIYLVYLVSALIMHQTVEAWSDQSSLKVESSLFSFKDKLTIRGTWILTSKTLVGVDDEPKGGSLKRLIPITQLTVFHLWIRHEHLTMWCIVMNRRWWNVIESLKWSVFTRNRHQRNFKDNVYRWKKNKVISYKKVEVWSDLYS